MGYWDTVLIYFNSNEVYLNKSEECTCYIILAEGQETLILGQVPSPNLHGDCQESQTNANHIRVVLGVCWVYDTAQKVEQLPDTGQPVRWGWFPICLFIRLGEFNSPGVDEVLFLAH